MGTRHMRIAAPCPACQAQTLEYTAMDLDIPYFGELLQTVVICTSCGFRHSDVIHGRTQEPRRWTFRANREEHMSVRVVRSTSGTVRIPELGVHIEPGPASEAFVSNIEGILDRVIAVIDQIARDAETPEERDACDQRLDMIQQVRRGQMPVTVIIEDPNGNSLIVHEDAKSERIPDEEAAALPRGEITFDVSDLAGPGNGDGVR